MMVWYAYKSEVHLFLPYMNQELRDSNVPTSQSLEQSLMPETLLPQEFSIVLHTPKFRAIQ